MSAQLSIDRCHDMNDAFHGQACMTPTYGSHTLQQQVSPNSLTHVSPNSLSDQCSTNSSSQHDVDNMLLTLEKRSRCLMSPSDGMDGGKDQNGVEKPFHSYIALISMAVLSSKEKKMLLNDIYQYIMDNFPYYNNNEKAWRNSIRHNLSLNECFVKCGRADNGKGHFWAIHPACIEDFTKGDFRRRHARRRAKRNGHRGSEMDVSQMPISYRYNIGYVPMTPSSGLGYPYSTYFNSPPVGFRPSYAAQEPSPAPMYHLAKNTPMNEPKRAQQPYGMTTW